MSDRNIHYEKFGYLERSIVGVVSFDLKEKMPTVYNDIITGLQSAENSSEYKEAVEALMPYLNTAIKTSSIRTTNSEKEMVIKQMIERMKTKEPVEIGPNKDGGNGEVLEYETEVFSGSPAFQAGRVIGTVVGEIIESFKGLGDMEKQIQASAIGERIVQWEDEEKLNNQEVIIRIQERVNNAPQGEREVWQIFLDKLSPNQGAMIEPQRGMINAVDQGLSPMALAQWEPEAVEARMQQRMA